MIPWLIGILVLEALLSAAICARCEGLARIFLGSILIWLAIGAVATLRSFL